MKKIISMALCLVLSICCLTGCKEDITEKKVIVNEKIPTTEVVETENDVKKDEASGEVISEEKEVIVNEAKVELEKKEKEVINYEVIECKKNDDNKICKIVFEEFNIEDEFSYKEFPDDEYIYSNHIPVNGEVKIIYTKSLLADEIAYNDFDVMMYSGALNTTAISSDSISSNKGAFNIFGMGSADGFIASESVSFDEEYFDTSEFKDVNESGYLSVKTNPLSTFAADVDTASYSNLRNILRKSNGKESYLWNDIHDVRVEEMLNYFDYNIEANNDEIFTIKSEISETPWNKDTQLLTVNIKTKELDKEKAEGSNLVFLIDVSGSMYSEDKIDLLKESLILMVEELTEKDVVSIVTYSGDERVVLEGVKGSEKEEIIKAINDLETGGSTNGEAGLKKAYDIAIANSKEHNNNRIIMCSDGDLNVGMSSEDQIFDFVSKKRDTGVYLSVLGFGNGNYKDNKMETLADNGNGNYYYIDSLLEGKRVLVDELMSTLVTVADDVKFQLEFNPEYIKGYRKIGYENRDLEDHEFNDDTKDGGEVGYGHDVVVVYEIIPVDSELEIGTSDLKYQTTENKTDSTDWLTLSIRYKDHGEKQSKLIEYVINEDSYTEDPSDNWKFMSNVIGFGLLINESEYKGELTIENVIEGLQNCELEDDYKKEFLSLAKIFRFFENEE